MILNPARVLFVSTLLLASSGGSGGSPAAPLIPAAQTVVLTSTASIDGFTSRSIRGLTHGLLVGDQEQYPGDTGYRSIVSFDVSSVPAQADIVAVTLRLYQARIEGQPYVVLGQVHATHVDIGDELDYSEFDQGTISELGVFSTDTGLEYKELVVSEAFRTDRLAGRTRSQFRVQFSRADANLDGQDTYAGFEGGDNAFGTGNLPELVIEYRLQ